MTEAGATQTESWHWPRLIAAWAIAGALVFVVIAFTPGALRFEWMTLLIGVCTLVSFGLQLGTAKQPGFITRLSFSVMGCVTIICVIAGAAYLITAARL